MNEEYTMEFGGDPSHGIKRAVDELFLSAKLDGRFNPWDTFESFDYKVPEIHRDDLAAKQVQQRAENRVRQYISRGTQRIQDAAAGQAEFGFAAVIDLDGLIFLQIAKGPVCVRLGSATLNDLTAHREWRMEKTREKRQTEEFNDRCFEASYSILAAFLSQAGGNLGQHVDSDGKLRVQKKAG